MPLSSFFRPSSKRPRSKTATIARLLLIAVFCGATAALLSVWLALAGDAAESTGAAPSDNELCYRWNAGERYSYRISCKAEVGDTLIELTGTNTYTFGPSHPVRPFFGEFDSGQGSGTAFVVSADGFLLTCDHVVHNATEVKVTLGNKTVPCKVVANDATHDSLTGLLNHGTSKERLAAAVNTARTTNDTLAVAMIDIDHFKKINDKYGHPMGDQVIRSLA